VTSTEIRTYRNVLVDREETIAYVTMSRPERRNALSLEHMQELIDCFKTIGRDRDIAVAILRGEGPAFCAGHDLSEMIGRDAVFYRHVFEVCTELMETVQAIPQPVIAQVQGIATAAGCQLAATCDLVVAADDARFATPGVKIGLFCSTPMVEVSRAVGRKRALEMLLTGAPIDAQTASEWGLVNRVVVPEELLESTRALASQIVAASPLTIRSGKRAYYDQIDLDLPGAYTHCQEVMSQNATAEDAQEGMCAFLDKREPVWRGR